MNLEEIVKWKYNGREEKAGDVTLENNYILRSSSTWRSESQNQIKGGKFMWVCACG